MKTEWDKSVIKAGEGVIKQDGTRVSLKLDRTSVMKAGKAKCDKSWMRQMCD